jgi:Leucine-rich repeat (LRR) protein
LKKLSITGNGFEFVSSVSGLDAVGELPDLESLHLFGLRMTDVNFAVSLHKLNELSITNTPLTDITALRQTKALRSVSLTGTSVVDISPLLDLQQLAELGVVRTPARSDVISELERRGVKIQR